MLTLALVIVLLVENILVILRKELKDLWVFLLMLKIIERMKVVLVDLLHLLLKHMEIELVIRFQQLLMMVGVIGQREARKRVLDHLDIRIVYT